LDTGPSRSRAPERDIDHTAQAIASELIKFRDQARAGHVVIPQPNSQ
jgi:hypothetical protein